MFEWAYTAIKWLPWLGGFGGIALAVAAYMLGARAVVEAVAPLLKGLSDFIVEFFKTFFTGLKETFDSFAQVVFLGTVIFCSAIYFDHTNLEALRACNAKTAQVTKQLKAQPKKYVQRATPKAQPSTGSTFVEPRSIWGF